MSELRFWKNTSRAAILANAIVWTLLILTFVMLMTGCRVRKPWPWQKPFTYNCRVYVPTGSVAGMHAFIVWNHNVLHPVYLEKGWWNWYGDPWNTGRHVLVASSRGGSNPEIPPWNLPPATQTLWNRPFCP